MTVAGTTASTTAPALVPPLLGWTVAVTGERRGADLVALLEARGARTVHVPAVRTVPLADTAGLHEATLACLAQKLDTVVVTTGAGFATWLETADGWGLGERLRSALGQTRILARGPKASGAVRTAGLSDAAEPGCESTWDILERLLELEGLTGSRVLVQRHGAGMDDFTRVLRTAGADVLELPVYRTAPPEDHAALDRLAEQVVAREVHALTFTSAAAATHLLDAALRVRLLDDLLDALDDVVPVCVGAVAAAPLERLGVDTVRPRQARLGALVHAVTTELERRAVQVDVAGRVLEVRGCGALLDGEHRALSPAPMAVLRVLARQPGRVVPRAELLRVLPGEGDEHAAEMAVTRLRSALGDPALVRTVVKRGYRLAHDAPWPEPDRLEEEQPVEPPRLLDSVGGRPGIRDAVERLYERLLNDPDLGHYFEAVEMPRLKRHQVLLLSQLLGGPAQYAGRELAAAHAGLRITTGHYDRVVGHLTAVLQELGVAADAVAAIRRTLEELAADVVTGDAP